MRFQVRLVAMLAIAATSCQGGVGTVPHAAQARGANVLLVTIDTLRRDRVGVYGNRNGLTPTIDRVAAQGIVYLHAYAHAPMTLPSHTSILRIEVCDGSVIGA